ncbi:tyrosine-type recombinase/integrase [Spirosoma endbachense]|nr:phage integrase SAM-like domain-containing protein [Spirosoma endbachense]
MELSKNSSQSIPPFRLCKLYHFNHDTSKTWLLEFYQWNVKTQQCERRFFSRYFNKLKNLSERLKEAQKWERFINQQLENGAVYNPDLKTGSVKPVAPTVTAPAPTGPKLLADLTCYLSTKKSTLAENSYKVYRNFGDKLKAFLKKNKLEHLATKDITPELCERYRDYILKKHDHPTTRNKEIGQFKTFCFYYSKKGRKRFEISPAVDLEFVPKQESEMHEPYSDEQAVRIFAHIEQKQDFPLLLFIYFIHYCFARPGQEVRLMKVGDLRERSVMIRPGRSKTSITKSPTLPKPLAELIDLLKLRSYPAEYYVFGNEGKPGPVPVGKNHFYYRHSKILSDLGIKGKYTVYGWKHTGNIKAIRLGINPKKLQLQNGFTEYKTMEIYTRRLAAFADDEIYEKFI